MTAPATAARWQSRLRPGPQPAHRLKFWLLTDVPLWRARKRKERNTGLLGTDGLHGALWIERCNWIHTFGMRYDIDVVYIDRHGLVVAVTTIARQRLGAPRFNAHSVIELEAGRAAQADINEGKFCSAT